MSESEIEIKGGRVVYEFVGPEHGDVLVITPGGRFSKKTGGVPELADAMAKGGWRVLLWDRPNCGRSDVQLFGRSESHMRAEILGLLLKQLDVEKVVLAGGSGGARDSIVFTIMFPEMVRKLATWSIVGGTYSTMSMAALYILKELDAVRSDGMDGVLRLSGAAGGFAEMVAANPRNKDRLLSLGAEAFEAAMVRWLDAFVPKPNEVIPGVPDWEIEQIKVPTLIVRGGERDFDHPKRTSMEIHSLIKGSRLVDPPWPEDAWEQAVKAWKAGKGQPFDPWPLAAPMLLKFFAE